MAENFIISNGILIAYNGNDTEVTIPNNVKSIGYKAFYSCKNIISITIPDSVTSIGYNTFFGCTNLTKIKVSENNNKYCDIDGVLFTKDKKTIIVCPAGKKGVYSIPDGVTNIDEWAFEDCDKLKTVSVPLHFKGKLDNVFPEHTEITYR